MKYKIGDQVRLNTSDNRDESRGVVVETDNSAVETYLIYTIANGWADWFEESKILGYYSPRNTDIKSELSGNSGELPSNKRSKYYTADPTNWQVI